MASGGDSEFSPGGNLFCFPLSLFSVNQDTEKGRFKSGRVEHVLCACVCWSALNNKKKKKKIPVKPDHTELSLH